MGSCCDGHIILRLSHGAAIQLVYHIMQVGGCRYPRYDIHSGSSHVFFILTIIFSSFLIGIDRYPFSAHECQAIFKVQCRSAKVDGRW